jgi:hypothetical protein
MRYSWTCLASSSVSSAPLPRILSTTPGHSPAVWRASVTVARSWQDWQARFTIALPGSVGSASAIVERPASCGGAAAASTPVRRTTAHDSTSFFGTTFNISSQTIASHRDDLFYDPTRHHDWTFSVPAPRRLCSPAAHMAGAAYGYFHANPLQLKDRPIRLIHGWCDGSPYAQQVQSQASAPPSSA